MTTFRLPDLGEGLTESTIITWYVAEGEEVELNQPLAEVETAKAVVDLPSPYTGRITALHAAEGETLAVGAPLVDFDVAAASSGHEDDDGGSRRTGDGDSDTAPVPAAAPRHDAAFDGAAPAAAPGGAPSGSADDPAGPDPRPAPTRHSVLVGYGPALEAGTRPRRRARTFATVPYEGRPEAERTGPTPRAMPPVRALARRLGVDLAAVRGTGPDGLVRRADVEQAASGAGASTFVPVTGLRKHTAQAMTESAFTAPHAAVFSTVDVTETLALVRRAQGRGSTAPTFLSLACRAVVLAAGRTPSANARFDAEAGHIEQFGSVHLGIAVATDRGLVVPTIRDADAMDAGALAAAITERARKAREGALSWAELSGSTLTVTNVGVFGVDGGVPILNPGQSAIVGLGTVRRRPWEHAGEVALREVVTVTVSFDHRVLDGAEAATFLTDITDVLSDPALTLVR